MNLPPVISVSPAPELSMRPGPFIYHVKDLGDGLVGLFRDANDRYPRPVMPRASLKHFVNDLAGRVELPLRGHREIDAITRGRAKLLGKGDDGLAFQVGAKVVKVSTTVPYHPENPGHLTPDEATERLRRQTEIHNHLATIVPNTIDRAEFVRHGDKGFQIKPYVEIPARFTREQLDQLQDALVKIHRGGYVIHDQIQAGVRKGKVIMFDVGKAHRTPTDDARWGSQSDVNMDMYELGKLYKASGIPFLGRDLHAAEQAWQVARSLVLKAQKEERPAVKKMRTRDALEALRKAAESRRDQANSTLRGPALAKRLHAIDSEEYQCVQRLQQ